MEEQNNQNQNVSAPIPNPGPAPEIDEIQAPKGSRNMVFLFSGVLAVAVVILAVAGYFYYKNTNVKNATPTFNTYTSYSTPTTTPPSPSPVSQVSNSSDLTSVINELNSTTDKGLQSDLDQANAEGSNF